MWLPLSTTPRHVLAPTVIGYDSSPFTSQSLGLPFFPNTYIPHMAHTLRPIIKLWNVSAPAHFRNLDTPHVRMIRICHGSLIHVACGAGPFEYQDLSSECCRLCPILICVRDGGTHNGMMHSLSSFVTVRTPLNQRYRLMRLRASDAAAAGRLLSGTTVTRSASGSEAKIVRYRSGAYHWQTRTARGALPCCSPFGSACRAVRYPDRAGHLDRLDGS